MLARILARWTHMSFGKRTASVVESPRSAGVRSSPKTGRGGYWLGLLSVPATFLVIATGMGIFSGSPLSELLAELPASAFSLCVVAAVVLLLSDFALRRVGWRNPWAFAVVCGLALFGVCFVTSLPAHYLVPFALIPGFCGGWVLGWSRR